MWYKGDLIWRLCRKQALCVCVCVCACKEKGWCQKQLCFVSILLLEYRVINPTFIPLDEGGGAGWGREPPEAHFFILIFFFFTSYSLTLIAWSETEEKEKISICLHSFYQHTSSIHNILINVIFRCTQKMGWVTD